MSFVPPAKCPENENRERRRPHAVLKKECRHIRGTYATNGQIEAVAFFIFFLNLFKTKTLPKTSNRWKTPETHTQKQSTTALIACSLLSLSHRRPHKTHTLPSNLEINRPIAFPVPVCYVPYLFSSVTEVYFVSV
jgi:hypothetical protein